MANIRKKIINTWDGGIKTSPRDNNTDTSYGAQMIKGFDVYKDSKKLIPMQSWETFTTASEQAYGIRAMGGTTDTVYGLGNGLSNWYSSNWSYRVRVDVDEHYHRGSMPLRLNMADLPSEFWDNVRSDMADVRVTSSDGVTAYAVFCENIDTDNETGDMWIEDGVVSASTVTELTTYSATDSDATTYINPATPSYAVAFPVTLSHAFNSVTIKCCRTGSPSNLIIDLYSDVAGSPGVLVQTLGYFTTEMINNSASVRLNRTIYFDTVNLTGAYHIVMRAATIDGSNFYNIAYAAAGNIPIRNATNVGLTAWTDADSNATPCITLKQVTPSVTSKYFYIYYGNSTATAIDYGTPAGDFVNGGRNVFNNSSIRWAYTFGDESLGNKYYSDNTTGTEVFNDTPQIFSDGLFGKAIHTAGLQIATDIEDDIGLNGSDVTLTLLVKISELAAKTFYQDSMGTFDIGVDVNGRVTATFAGSVATTVNTSSTVLGLNQWHLIQCRFDDDAYITVDGVTETFDINDGNFSGVTNQNTIDLGSGNNVTMSQVWGFNNNLTDAQLFTQYNNYFREDMFIIGAQQAKTSVALTYSGFQLYQKSITSGDWSDYLEGGRPVKSMEFFPVNGFIDSTVTYFITSQSAENGGFLFLSRIDSQDVFDGSHLLLSTLSSGVRIIPQPATAIDNVTYFTYGASNIASVGDPGDSTAFAAVSRVESLVPWRTYLATGSNSRNNGYINIWDLASSNSTEKINVGTGNVRIVGNAQDILFTVVDNFIDDAVRSSNKPTMEIKQYIGNGEMETTHVLEIPAIIDDSTYADAWERAVSTFKIQRNTQTLFYARLPNNEAGDSFDEGLWAVGKNSQGQLCLILQISTEGLGMPENIFGFAQQVFFIKKDGGIVRLSDNTYSDVSLFTTLKMNEGNTEIEKKLHGVEIVTEPLESGQTISLYYKRDGDASRTKIGDFTGTDEVSAEFLYDDNGNNFFNYKEIEFDIESTGGKSAPLELNYKYEYLSDIV